MSYMTNEDQAAMIGRKALERRDSRRRLKCLVERAEELAKASNAVAAALSKAAKNSTWEPLGGEIKPSEFVSKEEFETLLSELDAERKRVSRLDKFLNEYL